MMFLAALAINFAIAPLLVAGGEKLRDVNWHSFGQLSVTMFELALPTLIVVTILRVGFPGLFQKKSAKEKPDSPTVDTHAG
jgi:hypothetical protein